MVTCRGCLGIALFIATAQLHGQGARPILVDGHTHITNRVYWEGIDPWTPQPVGPWDYARARAAGVNVVIENIAPYGYYTYNTTVKQAARLIETFHRVLDANGDKMELALNSDDVRRIVGSGKLAVILGIEAGFDQDGDVDVLRLWHRLGVRLVQFSSHVTNAYSDAVRGGTRWNGINERGRRLIAEMNRLGIIIDITHASEAAQLQIIEASRTPVVASHVGMRALCGHPANLSDTVLRALAAKGGLVGIVATAEYISPRYYGWTRNHAGTKVNGVDRLEVIRAELPLIRSPNRDYGEYTDSLDARMGGLWRQFYSAPFKEDPAAEMLVPTVDEWADHVAYAVSIAGADHVGLGLDMSHGKSLLKGVDGAGYPQLIAALRPRGVPPNVLGATWLRVMDEAKLRASPANER